MDILFNSKGFPLMMSSDKTFVQTTGAPKMMTPDEAKKIDVTVDTKSDQDFTQVDTTRLLSWGASNNFPQWADQMITSTSVLNSGLKFIRNFTLGQGIYACKVTGYDADGDEILEAYPDPKVQEILNRGWVRKYFEKTARDYFKFGCAFVQLIPSVDGKSISGVNNVNAYFTRLSERNKSGREKCVVSGKFPDSPSKDDLSIFDVLLDYDPEMDLDFIRMRNQFKDSLIMVVRDSWSNHDTYSEPVWLSAYLAGWVDIAKEVPTYLNKVYKNSATWKQHVQIPYSFWEKRFPEVDYPDKNIREAAIQSYMDDIEENLLGSKNAEKPLFTHYAVNDMGKIEEEWKITALDNKSKEGDKLVTSAAANSEILFALMINPNVLGAGMPGGTYAGNQGGSNIREAFLVNIANAWVDRQNLLDPIQLMLRFNGYTDVTLRYRNTILTTLDSGAGTTQNLA